MRYDLLHYKNVPQPDGSEVRLEIYQGAPEDEMLYPLPCKLGDVLNGLRLDIEGQGEVDEPIVKTSLTFTLVDAPERNTGNAKWGNWEFFYTSNAVGYKVVLLGRRKEEAEFRTMWTGFVTPDSYTESLQYHGVVSITARDNIGHLQDFDFDAVGNADQMMTPYELITQAWELIGAPMRLDWRAESDENLWPQTGGVNAPDTYINVAAFKGKTWLDAVSDTLYAYGLVMRYVGNNIVTICPLRRMATIGRASEDAVEHRTPLFEAYATRELVPAVKEVREVVEYSLEDGVEVLNISESDFTGGVVQATANAVNIFGSVTIKQVDVWPIANEGEIGWGNIKSNTLFFNPFAYNNLLAELTSLDEQFFLATNTNDRMIWFGRYINCQRLQVSLEHGIAITKKDAGIMREFSQKEVKSITGAIKLTIDGTEYYYDGSQFTTAYKELTMPFEEGVMTQDVAFHKLSGQRGLLQLFIFRVNVEWLLGYPNGSTDKGTYLGFKPLNFSMPYVGALMEKNTIKTVINEENNIRMERTPALGPVYDEVAMPGLIENGIFRKEGGNYLTTEEWGWYNEDARYQLGALVHMQMVGWFDKPNSLISGTILNADITDPRTLWMWKGKEHYLQSGSYDYLTGRLENAVLREFERYEDLWS